MLALNQVIAVDMGHSLSSCDYGAVGIKHESLLTREVGKKVISKLQSLGYKVVDCTIDNPSTLSESLSYRVNKANNSGANFYISIHFNAFNGQANGTEVLTYKGKEVIEARAILNNLEILGFKNRCKDSNGNVLPLKDGSNLYVLKNTKCPSCLVEICFCDNKDDMSIFNSDKVADAIVKGLVGKTVGNVKVESKDNIISFRQLEVMQGEDVKAIQNILYKLKLLYHLSGFYDMETRESIITYQKAHSDLKVTGIVDKATWDSLMVHNK